MHYVNCNYIYLLHKYFYPKDICKYISYYKIMKIISMLLNIFLIISLPIAFCQRRALPVIERSLSGLPRQSLSMRGNAFLTILLCLKCMPLNFFNKLVVNCAADSFFQRNWRNKACCRNTT